MHEGLKIDSEVHANAPFWKAVREQFPVLHQEVNGRPLAYLDNAASSQMPQPVIDRLVQYQSHEHANIHRGVHHLSQLATDHFEEARRAVARFIGAAEDRECIFTCGATDAINLVMHGYGRKFVEEGDEILVTELEHHSNIVPWQMLCEEKGAELRVVPITDDGRIEADAFADALTDRTKLVGLIHVSNALGTINDVRGLVALAHERGVPVLVDGSQAVPHVGVDVGAIDADFYAFSSHKMCGPTGVGVLYGKAEHLEAMQPYRGGGSMILNVTFEETTYDVIPHKFEAGTPPILGVIGLGAAIAFLEEIGMENIAIREHELLAEATERIEAIDGVRILGPKQDKAAVLSLDFEGVHPHDVGTILDQHGVAIRAGHHCTQPLMERLGVPATARASLAFYNDENDVDALIEAIGGVREIFG